MAIEITGKFKPKSGKTFSIIDAVDVEMPDGTRLSDFKGGASITVDSALSTTSTNPIQNKAVAQRLSELTDEFSETIENVTEMIPGLDDTLSETGKAADAKAVGAAITQATQDVGQILEQVMGAIPTDAHINELIDAYLSEALGGDY